MAVSLKEFKDKGAARIEVDRQDVNRIDECNFMM